MMSFDLSSLVQDVVDLAEKHAGLGGWVGAVGAILAIFVTWGLARAEYLRTKRQAIARQRAGIRLMRMVIFDFDLKIMQPYIKALQDDNDTSIDGYYARRQNYAEVHAMIDLAHLPVTEWPAVDSYFFFKRYWFNSTQLLNMPRTALSDIQRQIKANAFLFKTVDAMLERAYGRAVKIQEDTVDETVVISEPRKGPSPSPSGRRSRKK